jgi:hypothetical protein
MKKIIITGNHLKRGFFIWFLSFIVAVVINIYSIVKYDTSWTELYSQIGFVVMISVMIYIVVLVFRGLFFLLDFILRKRK